MAKKIVMDDGYDKKIADAVKRGKQLDRELAKGRKTTPAKKKVKRK